MTTTREHYERPRFANDTDHSGGWWRRRGRWFGWVDPTEWIVGVNVNRVTPSGYGSIVFHLGPLWIAREFG